MSTDTFTPSNEEMMKVWDLSYADIVSALKAQLGDAVKTKFQTSGTGSVQLQIIVNALSATVMASTSASIPCEHAACRILKGLFAAGATKIVLHKHTFEPASATNIHKLYLLKGWKGLCTHAWHCVCCGEQPAKMWTASDNTIEKFGGIGFNKQTTPCVVCGHNWYHHTSYICNPELAPVPKTAHKSATTTKHSEHVPIGATPDVGPRLTGDTTELPHARGVYAAVCGFYVLQELMLALKEHRMRNVRLTLPDPDTLTLADYYAACETVYWPSRVARVATEYAAWSSRGHLSVERDGKTLHYTLGREDSENMDIHARTALMAGLAVTDDDDLDTFRLDYARKLARNMFDYLTLAAVGEARHKANLRWDSGDTPSGRGSAFRRGILYDPRTILPVLDRVFAMHWNKGYGGKAWRNIVRAARQYWTLYDMPDVFLDHVVDVSHNGGLAFDKGYILGFEFDDWRYKGMLNAKRDGSLLMQTDVGLCVDAKVKYWIDRLVRLGVIGQPRASIKVVADKAAPAIAWGAATFKLAYKETEGDDDGEEEEEENEARTEIICSNRFRVR